MVPFLNTPTSARDEPRIVNKWPSVTIIVAVTRSMGMSYNTHLPWPRLKAENDHFESTTKYTPSQNVMNAVIMGYNTWDDDPTKLFPDRINVVVTRDPTKVWARVCNDTRDGLIHTASSLEEAVVLLERSYGCWKVKAMASSEGVVLGNDDDDENFHQENRNELPRLGRIFVIGGAMLCRQAVNLPWIDRLLLTCVMADFKVDTFFPITLNGRGNGQWERQSDEIFQEWGGTTVPIGVQYENGLEWEVFMFERL